MLPANKARDKEVAGTVSAARRDAAAKDGEVADAHIAVLSHLPSLPRLAMKPK